MTANRARRCLAYLRLPRVAGRRQAQVDTPKTSISRAWLMMGLVASMACLSGVAVSDVAVTPSSTAEAPLARVDGEKSSPADRTVLRLATQLGRKGTATTGRSVLSPPDVKAGLGSLGRDVALRLRLQPSIEGMVPTGRGGARHWLPVGAINSGVWIRATHMQIRDGSVFLVGSADPMPADAGADEGHVAAAGR